MSKLIDLIGRRFGRLVVTQRVPRVKNKKGSPRWLCTCDCGETTEAQSNNLSSGKHFSCGCIRREGDYRVEHGHTRGGYTKISPTYRTWSAMKQRCNDPHAQNYVYYGGAGVTVCERWLSFENFFADMGERPAGKTIDRIDNLKGYEPGNCRWATMREQCTNRARYRPTIELTEDIINEICGRVEHGESVTRVARRFGMHRRRVTAVLETDAQKRKTCLV